MIENGRKHSWRSIVMTKLFHLHQRNASESSHHGSAETNLTGIHEARFNPWPSGIAVNCDGGHRCGSGSGIAVTVVLASSYSSTSTPSPGTSTCRGCGPKKKKKKKCQLASRNRFLGFILVRVERKWPQ